jgi:tetratricopeptide (TPR) repeat protein
MRIGCVPGRARERAEWPEAVLGPGLFVTSAVLGLCPVADGDVFWHLAAGREMVRVGSVLQRDPFSSGSAGQPWLDVHWLFQLGVYAVHELGGLLGLVLAKCVLIGIGAMLVYAAVDREARAIFVPLLLAALFGARQLLLVRPVIVTLVCLGFFFLQLERFRLRGRIAALAGLPLVQIVWSNCQGLFALGPALIAAYAVGVGVWLAAGTQRRFPFDAEGGPALRAARPVRALLICGAACVAASLCTPYGLRALGLPWALLTRLLPASGNPWLAVAENVPPFTLEQSQPGQFWHLKWFLGVLALAFALPPRRVLLSHLLLIAGLLALALTSNRNVLLLYWLATPIAAMKLAEAVRPLMLRVRQPGWIAITRALPQLALAALLLLAGTAAAREPNLSEPTPFHFPVQSARLLRDSPGVGTIFSADHQGGYLIWMLYPRFRPYMDTRLVLRTPQEYGEYLGLAENPQRFDAFQRRHRFSHAILPIGYPDRYLGLVAHLYGSSEWKLIFTDGSEALFAHAAVTREPSWDLSSPATTDRIAADLARRFAASSRLQQAALLQLATLELATGAWPQAERILSRIDASAEPNIDPRASLGLRARARLAADDTAGAQRLAEQLLGVDGDDPRSLDLMAAVLLRRGQWQRAAVLIRRALALDPFDPEAQGLLRTLELQHDEH